ncbi:MAG: C40 family peptidase [Alloprevotella sp.]|nr:C40 family peptidase [Alloprevotella sp.]
MPLPHRTPQAKALRNRLRPVAAVRLALLLLAAATASCTSQQHLRNRERYGDLPNEAYVGALPSHPVVPAARPAGTKRAHAAASALGIQHSRHDNAKLLEECASWLGTPYVYGGNSRSGVDCSGLTCAIYNTVYGKKLHRRSRDQHAKDAQPRQRRSLRQGDLVFFTSPRSGGQCGHVGIYLKDGKFIHASSSRGVVVDHLDQRYWQQHWLGGGSVP